MTTPSSQAEALIERVAEAMHGQPDRTDVKIMARAAILATLEGLQHMGEREDDRLRAAWVETLNHARGGHTLVEYGDPFADLINAVKAVKL